MAAYLGHHKNISELLDNGADIGTTDSIHGWTPLHSSVSVKSINNNNSLIFKKYF